MAFNKQAPEWGAIGIEPPESKRNTGWEVEDRPPAAWLNWFMNLTAESLQELQEKAAEKTYVDERIVEAIPDDASLTVKGITQLNSAVDSASETEAATPKAVKIVNDSLTTHLADNIRQLALKLNVSAYTAADILAKLKTVDGAGSGVDADLLDGKNATDFYPMTGGIINGSVGIGTPPGVTLAIGDADTGFHWIGDGNFHIISNGVVVAGITSAALDVIVPIKQNGVSLLRQGQNSNLPHTVFHSNVGTAAPYSGGQLELQCTDMGDVILGFHRAGGTATALVHESEGLKLVGSTGLVDKFKANFEAQSTTSYTARLTRNTIMSTTDPIGGQDGDIWIKYTP